MELEFTKMHGAGNDFIMARDEKSQWPLNPVFIRKICSRNRGIGADGLIVLKSLEEGNIRLRIFNSDGSEAEMCGNGLRCSSVFAFRQMQAGKRIGFSTVAGQLETEITAENQAAIEIPLVSDFTELEIDGLKIFYGNTGVPHAVIKVENIDETDVAGLGRKFRYHRVFAPAGTNVDFISVDPLRPAAFIRTYERGVEAETSACGTGAAAAAVCLFRFLKKNGPYEIITAEKDILRVELNVKGNIVNRIKLSGDALEVFRGKIETDDFR